MKNTLQRYDYFLDNAPKKCTNINYITFVNISPVQINIFLQVFSSMRFLSSKVTDGNESLTISLSVLLSYEYEYKGCEHMDKISSCSDAVNVSEFNMKS